MERSSVNQPVMGEWCGKPCKCYEESQNKIDFTNEKGYLESYKKYVLTRLQVHSCVPSKNKFTTIVLCGKDKKRKNIYYFSLSGC